MDVNNLRITTTVDGEVRQDDTTANMIHNVAELLSYVSSIFTLLPGDVIITGTPKGVSEMKPGQTVEVTIEGIGTLRNTVRDAE